MAEELRNLLDTVSELVASGESQAMFIQRRHLVFLIVLTVTLFHVTTQASHSRWDRNLGVSDGLIGGLDDFADDSVMLPRESQR